VEGAAPPPRGFGGCAPKIKKRGRVARINNQATSGAQNAGKPSANGGGQRGVQGAEPSGGVWGVSPHETKIWGELPTLTNPLRVGPKTLAYPKLTGVGKTFHAH